MERAAVKKICLILAVFILLGGWSSGFFAQSHRPKRGPSMNKRLGPRVNSQHRLNAREIFRIERREARIARMEKRFRKSNPGLSRPPEAKRRPVNRGLNRTDGRIFKQKHNRQSGHNRQH